MTKREFNKTMNACVNRRTRMYSIEKLAAIPDETKERLVKYIVRNRGPIVSELIGPLTDQSWLRCCGYLYRTKGKNFQFVHTCEHKIK